MLPATISYLVLFAIIALILVIALDDDGPRYP
jgi:hypothetical protein